MRHIFSFLLLCMACTMVMAQKITVESFGPLSDGILTASTHRRNDVNGEPCALVLVQLTRPGATFEGNVMGDTPYSQSEYYVYMMKGSKMLKVMLEGYHPVMVDFTQYGVTQGVEGLKTYSLVLNLPNVAGQAEDDGMTYFALKVSPPNAIVQIDEKLYTLDGDGELSLRLPRGKHLYQLQASGYAVERGEFDLGNKKLSLKKTLKSSLAQLVIECPTTGVDFYVNDEKKGSGTSWKGSVKAGDYLIEVRKEGYVTQQRSITLSDNQSLKVNFTKLMACVGQLDLNYKPLDSEVWIDGNKVGTSPDVFKNLTVGSHLVEIRSEGYQSESRSVTITEGQTASLSGSLVATASSSSAMSTSSTSTSTSSSSMPAKQIFSVDGVSFTMVRVEGGTFTTGFTLDQGNEENDDDKPAALSTYSINGKEVTPDLYQARVASMHSVTLSTYFIGETEVTQELWEAVMGSTPSHYKGMKHPAQGVSWNDCQNFIEKLNEKTGKTFRLPTEAEWEYAARGGKKSQGYKYSGSNNLDSVGWYWRNSGVSWLSGEWNYDEVHANKCQTHEVAQKKPNELGLYDMSGNVWEWCSDWFDDYSSSSQTNPQGPERGYDRRVIRGGSWYIFAWLCRSSIRDSGSPDIGVVDYGFRLALSE